MTRIAATNFAVAAAVSTHQAKVWLVAGWLLVIAVAVLDSRARCDQQPPAKGEPGPRPPTLKTQWGDVEIFPADSPWNKDIRRLPVDRLSADYMNSIGGETALHPDFGTVWQGAPNGIPFCVVGPDQPLVPVEFQYADESDPGPYPIPRDAPIEGGPKATGDRHVIVIDAGRRRLYETFAAWPQGTGWRAESGAVFDLARPEPRPAGWTSADAAGLPIFPGLVRYDEAVEQGEIRHALRFTVKRTQRGYVFPATHFASRSSDPKLPPMGLRLRLKASFNVEPFPPVCRVILRALKTHGMFLADNGGNLFLSGAPDPRWNDDELRRLKQVKLRDFEVIETGPITTR